MANEELINILRSVIQDELAPVKDELQCVKMELMDTRAQMNSCCDIVEAKLSRVEAGVTRIEAYKLQDIMRTMIKQTNAKLDANQDLMHKVDELKTDLKLIKMVIRINKSQPDHTDR